MEQGKLCVDKAAWLRDSPLNYFALSFEAKTAKNESELGSIYAEKTCGAGASITGQLCTCASSSPYYNVKLDACVATPTQYDGEHDIRYNVSIPYAGQLLYRQTLLDLDACTEVAGYRTTDYQQCVASCPDYMDNDDRSTLGRYENGLDHANRWICKCASNPKTYAFSIG